MTAVERALQDLAADARRIAAGDLAHEVRLAGPPEVAALAGDIEAIRRRLVAEMAAAAEAREDLDAQAVELRRSNAELEQFAYVASHDLQEPLRKVASFCQLLERRYADQLDDRATQYIEFAVDGAKRMQSLINDLLAFSRVGRTTDRFVSLDMGALVSAAMSDLAERIEAEDAKVEVVGALPAVQGDRSLLRAVLVNVIGNAIKFRGDDPPHIRIEADDRDPMWAFRVSDNGIGIPEAYAERVFVIFQRLHGRDEYEGTGIGLALCRKIIEFHGGRMWVEAPLGDGATVCFTLPKHHDQERQQ